MKGYIDIDILGGKVNGKPVMLRKVASTLDEVQSQPGRYLCLLRNESEGKYRYADVEGDSAGDSADNDC